MSLTDDLKNPNYNIFAQAPTKKVQKDNNDYLKGSIAFENGVKMLLGTELGGAGAGFSVIFEARKYRPSQYGDKILTNIRDQLEGKAEKVCEVYFKGSYLCDITESMRPEQALATVQKALFQRIQKTV